MGYIYLIFIILLYFPLTLTNKLSSEGTEKKEILLKYSLFRAIAGTILGGGLLIFNRVDVVIDLYTALTSLMFGIMLAVCLLLTFYSMQVTKVAIVSMFTAASVIIPIFFGIIFFGDPITVGKFIGIIVFLVAMYFIVGDSGNENCKISPKAFIACLGVLITSGLGSVSMQLFAKGVPNGEEAVFMFLSYCVEAVILFVSYIGYILKNKNKEKSLQKMSTNLIVYGIIGTIVTFLAQQIQTMLAAEFSAVILFPITMGSSVIMGILVGAVFFKEKLTKRILFGIIIGIASLIILNLC